MCDPVEDAPAAQKSSLLTWAQQILEVINQNPPIKKEALASKTTLSEEEFQEGFEYLRKKGKLLINNAQNVIGVEKARLRTGVVQANRSGTGFLICDDETVDDLFISATEMEKVLPGDLVIARESSGYDGGRRSAKLLAVAQRPLKRIIGRFSKRKVYGFVKPEDARLQKVFRVDPGFTRSAEPGQVVVAEVLEDGLLSNFCNCKIVEVLGDPEEAGMEIEIAVRKFNIPHEFSAETLEQVKAFPDKVGRTDLRKRIDLRDVPFVTIDGADARDFDDAVYCKPLPAGRGWRLLVAIADVSHYVLPGTPLDKDAQLRTTSVYFPRRVIPMLPEKLSNGLCSLNPQVDRCTMVCDAMITKDGAVKAYQFYPAVICSSARLTYDAVWGAIQNPKGPEALAMEEVYPNILDLYDLFKVLLKARTMRNAMEFETVETYIVANESGKIEKILPRERNDAHRLIEECMLVANTCAADFIERNKVPSLYRIHEPPSEDRLEKLRAALGPQGLSLGGGDKPTPADYCALIEQIQDRPDKTMLQTLIMRSMQQAFYSPFNAGHFGLAYKAYTHFTSPIRRYPDLLVHRTIRAILQDKPYVPKMLVPLNEATSSFNVRKEVDEEAKEAKWANDPSMKVWEQLGLQCSSCERRADEASWDVMAWLKCYYMKDKIGQEFEGQISAVTNFGIFVVLKDLFVEGSVHISNLGRDYFFYDEAANTLVGELTGQTFKVGDPVRIKVAACDLDSRRIDFQLIDSFKQGRSSTKKSSASKESKSAGKEKAASGARKAKSTANRKRTK